MIHNIFCIYFLSVYL